MHDASPNDASTLSVIEGTQTADDAVAAGARVSFDRPQVALADVLAGTGARAGVLLQFDGASMTDVHALRAALAPNLARAAHPELDVVLTAGAAQWLSAQAVQGLARGIGNHVLVIPVMKGGTTVGGALIGYDEPVAFSVADREFLVRAFSVRSAATSPLSVAAA